MLCTRLEVVPAPVLNMLHSAKKDIGGSVLSRYSATKGRYRYEAGTRKTELSRSRGNMIKARSLSGGCS